MAIIDAYRLIIDDYGYSYLPYAHVLLRSGITLH